MSRNNLLVSLVAAVGFPFLIILLAQVAIVIDRHFEASLTVCIGLFMFWIGLAMGNTLIQMIRSHRP